MDKLREEFEKQIREDLLFDDEELQWQPERNCYAIYGVHLAWWGYRASRVNSPVIPDGWIACSEQTPVADGAYWCWFGKEEPSVIQQRVCIWNNRHHEWCDSPVTHWMPLPAAPRPEN